VKIFKNEVPKPGRKNRASALSRGVAFIGEREAKRKLVRPFPEAKRVINSKERRDEGRSLHGKLLTKKSACHCSGLQRRKVPARARHASQGKRVLSNPSENRVNGEVASSCLVEERPQTP